jgi:hypothetical protein
MTGCWIVRPQAHRVAALALLVLLLALPGWSPVLAQDRPIQEASTDRAAGAPGERIVVTGSGWPVGALVQIATCGNLGLGGSRVCAMPESVATPVRADGTISAAIRVGAPPEPCPCVTQVSTVGATDRRVVALPFVVTGHPVGETPSLSADHGRLEVLDARLVGASSWTSWFGAPARRTLELQVRNAGGATTGSTPLTVGWGRVPASIEGEPMTHAVEALAPGAATTVTMPVTLPVAAMGAYHVNGRVGAADLFSVELEHQPWGLYALNGLGVLLLVAAIRWRVRGARDRRRLERRRDTFVAAPAVAQLRAAAPDVVHLPELGAYLVFDDAPSARRLRGRSGASLYLDALAPASVAPTAPESAAPVSPTASAVIDDGPVALPAPEIQVVSDASEAGSSDAIIDLEALTVILDGWHAPPMGRRRRRPAGTHAGSGRADD